MTEEIPIDELNELGIDINKLSKQYKHLEDLRKTIPAMVIAKHIMDINVAINNSKDRFIKKGDISILSLHMYNSMRNTEKNGVKQNALIPYEKTFKDLYKPYNGQDLNNKTLLVWRTGGIGDLLFIQPCLRHIKKKYPTCRIKFSCAPEYTSMLYNWDCIDQLIPLPMPFQYFNDADYHCTFEGVIERCKDAESINAYKLFSNWMGLNIEDKDLIPILKPNKKHTKSIRKILKDKFNLKEGEFIYLQLRASTLVRTPGKAHIQRIINPLIKSGYKIILNDQPRYHDAFDFVINELFPNKLNKQIFNFCKHSTNLSKAISLISLSKLVIGPDSSSLHIAGGLDIPCYGIFGPFAGEIRLSTYKNSGWIQPNIQNNNICEYGGSRCYLHGHMVCPNDINKISPCFELNDYEKASNEILEMLKTKKRS